MLKRAEYIDPEGKKPRPARRVAPPLSPRTAAILVVVLALLAVCVTLYVMFLEYIHPNEVGIKQVRFGLNQGIQEKVYGPGFAFVLPFDLQRIHRLPNNLQVLEMTQVTSPSQDTAARASKAVSHTRAAKIQTSDGFFVDVDATILYRITDPYKLVTTLGPGDTYLTRGILPKAEPFLKQTLGQLTTEQFYNSPLRVEKTELAKQQLNTEMQQYGITVEHVLVRYFKYTESIQANIEAKKLEDQLVFTNQTERKAAEQRQLLNRAVYEGQMDVKVTNQEGNAYAVRKKAEQDLYTRKKRAEADLLVKLADAQKEELRNTAMQALGADRKVALEMAEVLQGLEVIMLPTGGEDTLNPLDLDQMVRTLGVNEQSEGAPATATPLRVDEDLAARISSRPKETSDTSTETAAEAPIPVPEDTPPPTAEDTPAAEPQPAEASPQTEVTQ